MAPEKRLSKIEVCEAGERRNENKIKNFKIANLNFYIKDNTFV